MMRARFFFTSFLAAAAFAPAPARSAESTENRLREALRSASAQLRTLEDERAHWQATEAAQKKEIESLKAQLAAAESRKARVPSPSPELTARLAEQTEANQKLTESLAQCQAAASDATEAARSKEEQRAKLTAQVGLVTSRATTCEDKNARMYQLTQEILAQCERMTVGDTLMAPLEPLVGLRRVKLENLSQEFQDKLLEQKVNR